MIIKNESRIIKRCLDSVAPIVDYMTICDTGSEDGTQEIVRDFFAAHPKIKGQLFQHEWKHFGHNRSLSMDVAAQTGADYIFTIDADMIVELEAKGPPEKATEDIKRQLTLDQYLVEQRLGNLFYENTRFMKATRKWHCVGVTHEYWATKDSQPCSRGYVNGLFIRDLGDGGAKAEKFERDIRLLTQGVIDEPENERYFFYLAQSYKDTRQFGLAIKWYKRRIEAGGFQQEVWYSKFMIGHCYKDLEDWPLAVQYYMDAYNYDPRRAEPLLHVAQHYRETGKNILAFHWASHALTIPFPARENSLFVSSEVYVSALLYELSIVSFYNPGKQLRGLISCEKLLHGPQGSATRCLPWSTHAKTYGRLDKWKTSGTLSNRLFYLRELAPTQAQSQIVLPLAFLNDVPADSESEKKDEDIVTDTWQICNPFLCAFSANHTLATVRCVNYTLDTSNGTYNVPTGVVHTRTFAAVVENASLAKRVPLEWSQFTELREVEDVEKPNIYSSNVQDYEDVRMVKCCNQKWFGVATSREMNAETIPELVLLHFGPGPHSDRPPVKIIKVVRLRGHEDEKTQKNWMPFVVNDELHFVYMCEPLTILKANVETGQVEVVQSTSNENWHMGHYRGGTPGIPWPPKGPSGGPTNSKGPQDPSGFLFLIHEVVHHDNKRRTYTHRFIFMESSASGWVICKISHPFYFQHKGVEFVTGMTWLGNTLAIGVGKNDCEAWIFQVTAENVERWLTHGALLL